MKRNIVIAHLAIPVLFGIAVFIYATAVRGFNAESVVPVLLWGTLFYSAPHLLWSFITLIAKFSGAVTHAGFIGSSVALALIASLWFLPPDPSGLPMQWMMYWPLAFILQLSIASAVGIYRRSNQTEEGKSA